MSRELVVLSHLRWVFVWQRPQHLISRLAAGYDRTWFIEEPLAVEGLRRPTLRVEQHRLVTRVVLEVPAAESAPAGFDAAACHHYARLLPALLGAACDRTVWLYTPMALDIARDLQPSLLVYDVMDDLAAFRFAPPALVLRQRQALRDAHVVFTGGRSLHRGVVEHRPTAHCFPSGVEPEHYARAIEQRGTRPPGRPVAGYVGVVDERIDVGLVAGLAAALPDWDVQVVGPVVKIDADSLPLAPNIAYSGPKQYGELPGVMAGLDVALMPFALNEATRSISPTKTLEYLAAGLPVVSTRIPDVVAHYERIVDLRDDAAGFAAACRNARAECRQARMERVLPILRAQHWDAIAHRMAVLLDGARKAAVASRETA